LADVAGKLGVAEQVRLVAGLRWRILRNQLRKKGSRLDLIGMVWAAIFASLLVFGLSVAFYWGAYSSVSTGHLGWMTLLFWGIFLFWQIIPVFIAGFGATFEFRNLLRFPLSMSAFYLLALAYGLADFPPLAGVCWLLAITAGAAVADPPILPALLVIVVLFLLMNLTLERLLGSWFARLLARRRTREVIFGLIIMTSVCAQFIRPLVERYQHGAPPWMLQTLPYLSFLPPGLAGHAVAAAAEDRWAGVLFAAMGLVLYILLFGGLLWQRFAAQYRGEELSEAAAPARPSVQALSKQDANPGALDLLPPQVAAVLRKDFRYLTRNGFVAVSMLMPPLLVLLFSSQFAGRHPSVVHRGVSPDLFFPGMMGYLLLMLMMPAYNCFAYEGKGIQTYFTAPLRFGDVLLGKNLMHSVVLVVEAALSMSILAWRIGLPSTPVLIATFAGAAFSVIGQFAIANWTSVSFPRKLEFGSFRGQRNSGVAVWVGFGVQLLLASICSIILLLGKWTSSPWLPAGAFAGLAAASLAGYFASLDALTLLAEKKK
jgi:ABC-2 type transport system permease protein